MSTQVAFRANQVTASIPDDLNYGLINESSRIFTTEPTVDPVSDAINNVRFACTGAAPDDTAWALTTVTTRHRFIFHPQAEGRLTAHTHFMPQGGFSLTGRKGVWFFDGPGFAEFWIYTRMRVRVVGANGVEVLRSYTPYVNISHVRAEGNFSTAVSREGSVDADLLEFYTSRAFQTIVIPSDTVEVEARYKVQAYAQGGEFFIDFASVPAIGGEPGDGLNAPFAVINIAE